MADFTVSNVFSIVAACAKAYSSYPSKAIFFPISHHLEQMESTTWVLHWALDTSLLLDTGLGWESTGPNISSFCVESPHRALWKDPDWLAGPLRPAGEKLEPSSEEKSSTFLLPLAGAQFKKRKELCFIFNPPVSIWAPLSLHCCYHTIWFTHVQFRRLSLTKDLAVVQTGNLNWSKWVN